MREAITCWQLKERFIKNLYAVTIGEKILRRIFLSLFYYSPMTFLYPGALAVDFDNRVIKNTELTLPEYGARL
jgi:hypothetical protein